MDEGPRTDSSLSALARLPAVFAAGGSVTAGNSSQTSDGAAFSVLMSEAKAKDDQSPCWVEEKEEVSYGGTK